MNKKIKLLVKFLILVLVLTTFIACGGGGGNGGGKADFVGEWDYSSNDVLIINSDKTYEAVSKDSKKVKDHGKWRVKGDELQFKSAKRNRKRIFKILSVTQNTLKLRRYFHTSGRKAKRVKTLKRIR